jgi:hypothetical protein
LARERATRGRVDVARIVWAQRASVMTIERRADVWGTMGDGKPLKRGLARVGGTVERSSDGWVDEYINRQMIII